MKNKTTLLFLLFSVILLAGCPQKGAAGLGKAFIGGTEGLAISFLSGLPPGEVFDTVSPFNIGVRLENKGEYSIDDKNRIEVSVTGINPVDFGLTQAQLVKKSSDALKGLSLDAAGNQILGDSTEVDFPTMQYGKTVAGTATFTVRANVCYEYGTKMQGVLCVRRDLRGVTGDEFCNPNRAIPTEVSSAPIQITNVRQNVAASNKIDIFFTVKKVSAAADSLFKLGTNCDPTITNRDVVFVEFEGTGLGDLTCSGLREGTATSGYVTLVDGQREIRCSQTVTNPLDLETTIKTNLKYDYKEFADKQLSVRHVG